MRASGDVFTTGDLDALSELVAEAWLRGEDRDWSVPAGTLEWSCTHTADHAVDTVLAAGFLLAARRLDGYPDMGEPHTVGPHATPGQLVEALRVVTRTTIAVVDAAERAGGVRSLLFTRPHLTAGQPADYPPRAGLELALHAHDVCAGLGVPFEPPGDLCSRLREHTRPWPVWTVVWPGLPAGDDPWGDLLATSGRARGDTR
jgi:hypothetical protein